MVDVEGGTLAWERAGLPLVRGRYVLPLDRQVRIAAGVMVLLGTVLGYLVNPWFYALSAYCGAGLIFAGVTDVCPLSWTIAKMPWNQVEGGPAELPPMKSPVPVRRGRLDLDRGVEVGGHGAGPGFTPASEVGRRPTDCSRPSSLFVSVRDTRREAVFGPSPLSPGRIRGWTGQGVGFPWAILPIVLA